MPAICHNSLHMIIFRDGIVLQELFFQNTYYFLSRNDFYLLLFFILLAKLYFLLLKSLCFSATEVHPQG